MPIEHRPLFGERICLAACRRTGTKGLITADSFNSESSADLFSNGAVVDRRLLWVQEMEAARKDAVEKAVAAKEEAEEQLEEERALRERLMQAAASGELPRQAADDGSPVAASLGAPSYRHRH